MPTCLDSVEPSIVNSQHCQRLLADERR